MQAANTAASNGFKGMASPVCEWYNGTGANPAGESAEARGKDSAGTGECLEWSDKGVLRHGFSNAEKAGIGVRVCSGENPDHATAGSLGNGETGG